MPPAATQTACTERITTWTLCLAASKAGVRRQAAWQQSTRFCKRKIPFEEFAAKFGQE